MKQDEGKPGLFKPPRFRSGQDTESGRHATWLELFYDLVFVAAVSQLAHGLGDDYSWKVDRLRRLTRYRRPA